jgi:iron complex transport system substrate-binding protein
MERIVTGLRARNVPQIVLAPRSIADVLEEITRLAHALGVDSAAAAVVDAMRSQVAELQSARRDPPARVYLEWWPKPMFSPGADCYSNELIALAGGVNVFGDRAGSSVEISREELIHADPDVCFVSWCGVHVDKLDVTHLEKRGGLEDLRVVREGHVLPLDERFSGRPGPRMLEAARIMAEAIRRLPL